MTILDEILTELAKLEATRRRKGIVTPQLVLDSLPPVLRKQATIGDARVIAEALNAHLADQDPEPLTDIRSRAAGDTP